MDGKGDTVSTSFTVINEDLTKTGVGNGEEQENTNIQKELSKRIQSLRETMYSLKEQLKDEKELWRREIDELNKMQYNESIIESKNLESTSLDSPKSISICGSLDKKLSQVNETSMTVYEKHQQQYRDTAGFLGVNFDYQQQMRRQMAVHSYKRKLMEVERMCNIELARVKQTASYLEPLNKIASEWNFSQNETQKKQKYVCADDLHYVKNNHELHPSDIREHQFHMSAASSDLPSSVYVGELSNSGYGREHMINNMDSSYASSTVMYNEKDTAIELADLIIQNSFCECEDLPLI